MQSAVEVDTFGKDPMGYDSIDSAEYSTIRWNPDIRQNWSLHQDNSVGQKQKETLLADILKCFHLEHDYCQDIVWANEIWENHYKWIYVAETLNIETWSELTGYSFEVVEYNETITDDVAEFSYVNLLHQLPSVKAIVCEVTSDVKYLTTILDNRNLETREKIYDIEIQMFDLYPNKQFEFSVCHFDSQKDIDIFIKNKKILFYN